VQILWAAALQKRFHYFFSPTYQDRSTFKLSMTSHLTRVDCMSTLAFTQAALFGDSRPAPGPRATGQRMPPPRPLPASELNAALAGDPPSAAVGAFGNDALHPGSHLNGGRPRRIHRPSLWATPLLWRVLLPGREVAVTPLSLRATAQSLRQLTFPKGDSFQVAKSLQSSLVAKCLLALVTQCLLFSVARCRLHPRHQGLVARHPGLQRGLLFPVAKCRLRSRHPGLQAWHLGQQRCHLYLVAKCRLPSRPRLHLQDLLPRRFRATRCSPLNLA
jgi:hypothetical protein